MPPSRAYLSLVLAAAAVPAQSQSGLKTIDPPGGGHVVYGAVSGATSLPMAMGSVLRYVHTQAGERPRIGKFFQAKDSDSVATFFTVSSRGKTYAGIAIVTPNGGQPLGAILYDETARFPSTESTMMQALNKAWAATSASGPSPTSAAPPAAPAAVHSGGSAPAQPLHMATGGDRSASIGLPSGWRINDVAHGGLIAEGPNGEIVLMSVLYENIYDPRDPRSQRALSNPAFAHVMHATCPYGEDAFQSYVSVTNQLRQHNNLPPGDFKLVRSEPQQPRPLEATAIFATFNVDFHDGKGQRLGRARIGISKNRGLAFWTMSVGGSYIPTKFVDQDAATIAAMVNSYSENAAVIGQQTQAEINRIHAIGAASAQQAANAHATEAAQSASFNAHMDSIDRQSKAFQNYTLDQTQIQDNNRNVRGTVSNGYADALVKADPNRFQYVATQDFIKGVDY